MIAPHEVPQIMGLAADICARIRTMRTPDLKYATPELKLIVSNARTILMGVAYMVSHMDIDGLSRLEKLQHEIVSSYEEDK